MRAKVLAHAIDTGSSLYIAIRRRRQYNTKMYFKPQIETGERKGKGKVKGKGKGKGNSRNLGVGTVGKLGKGLGYEKPSNVMILT